MPGPIQLQPGRQAHVDSMQRLAVGAGAVGLTVPNDKVIAAYLRNSGGPIYYTVDGTVPSTSNGVEMVDGESALLNLHECQKFQAIQGAAAGTLTIIYYRIAP